MNVFLLFAFRRYFCVSEVRAPRAGYAELLCSRGHQGYVGCIPEDTYQGSSHSHSLWELPPYLTTLTLRGSILRHDAADILGIT